MSWWQFLQLDEPVVGEVGDYRCAYAEVSLVQTAATGVRDEFNKINTIGFDDLSGKAAEGLRDLIGDVDGCLKDLPEVLADGGAIFEAHGNDLEALRQKADEALARAQTRWNQLQDALRAEQAAIAFLARLKSQRSSLDSEVGSEDAEARRADLASSISSQEAVVSSREQSTTAARVELKLSRKEHGTLQDEEQALVDGTVTKIDGIDLRSLENPGLLESLAGWVGDGAAWVGERFKDIFEWIADLPDDALNMVRALSEGKIWDALFHLREVLDKLALTITIVGIAVCVIAAPFTGGASLAFIPAVLAVGEALERASFVTGAALYWRQHPHPETNEPISRSEMMIDFGLLVVPGGFARGGVAIQKRIGKTLSEIPRWQRIATPADSSMSLGFDSERAFRDRWTNAALLKNPTSNQGRPLSGAAAYSQRFRAGTELAAEGVYDMGEDVVLAAAEEVIGEAVVDIEEYLRSGPSLSDDRAVCQIAPR